jgi:hypothetical protein
VRPAVPSVATRGRIDISSMATNEPKKATATASISSKGVPCASVASTRCCVAKSSCRAQAQTCVVEPQQVTSLASPSGDLLGAKTACVGSAFSLGVGVMPIHRKASHLCSRAALGVTSALANWRKSTALGRAHQSRCACPAGLRGPNCHSALLCYRRLFGAA